MPFSEFDPLAVTQLQEEIQSTLNSIASRHGLRPVKLDEVKANYYKFTFSASFIVDAEINRDTLLITAAKYGLGSEFVDSALVIKGKRFRIIDFSTGIRPVVLEELSTGDKYNVSPKQLLTSAVEMESIDV